MPEQASLSQSLRRDCVLSAPGLVQTGLIQTTRSHPSERSNSRCKYSVSAAEEMTHVEFGRLYQRFLDAAREDCNQLPVEERQLVLNNG